jgi:hypothetical protein
VQASSFGDARRVFDDGEMVDKVQDVEENLMVWSASSIASRRGRGGRLEMCRVSVSFGFDGLTQFAAE